MNSIAPAYLTLMNVDSFITLLSWQPHGLENFR